MTYTEDSSTADRCAAPTVPDEALSRMLPQRVKLEATIGLERAIYPMFVAGLLILFIGIHLGPGHKSLRVVDEKTSFIIGFGFGGGMLLAAGLLWLLIDDYYVLDRTTRRILVHKGFRRFGKDFPLLERDQAAAIGLNCAPVMGKYGQTGWRYTPVVVAIDGREIELSSTKTDMECVKLFELNFKIQQWASALQCPWVQCPRKQEFQVRYHFDSAQDSQNS